MRFHYIHNFHVMTQRCCICVSAYEQLCSVIFHSFQHASLPHLFFFFNDTATTEIYTLPLHDALPILRPLRTGVSSAVRRLLRWGVCPSRSEEHTSELQSHHDLVCRLLLEKKT